MSELPLDFFRPEAHPGKANDRNLLLTSDRPTTHGDLDPKYYVVIRAIFLPAMAYGPGLVPIVLALLSWFFVPLWVFFTIVLMAIPLFYLVASRHVNKLVANRSEGLPHLSHNRGSIKTHATYQNCTLLRSAYAISPLRKTLLFCALKQGKITSDQYKTLSTQATKLCTAVCPVKTMETETDISTQFGAKNVDCITNLMFFQTSEGFCGPATINTLLLSVPFVKALPLGPVPGALSIDQLARKFESFVLPPGFNRDSVTPEQLIATHPFLSVEKFIADDSQTLASFTATILLANDPSKRVAMNFLRGPLFIPAPVSLFERTTAVISGHWSPIASVVRNPADSLLYALVLDVNHTYGAYLASVSDLYHACYSRDASGYRGLVTVTLIQEVKMLLDSSLQ